MNLSKSACIFYRIVVFYTQTETRLVSHIWIYEDKGVPKQGTPFFLGTYDVSCFYSLM